MNAKLEDIDVQFIRRSNLMNTVLGRIFGLDPSQIGKAKRRENYQYVPRSQEVIQVRRAWIEDDSPALHHIIFEKEYRFNKNQIAWLGQ